ncbi:P-loop containing nucleoside triphosphate hydrolase protein [Globomyces pollinis-pini]|nr:P-loop containing nucleoside triphosphate hydrolase protein [Globomyces pollinis-pini]
MVSKGSLVAVLGASGAGKSSFLDVLAGRKPSSSISGQVQINGRTDIPIKHASRYCTQEEALFGNLTVHQTLMYAAHFNLPKSTSLVEKNRIVDELLEEFGLQDVKDTIIGTPLLKGCSGGQVRRVSVASQIIGLKGGILFLDEPTSGLDSVAANAVINSVRQLAVKDNATVIATIHQPSTETFELFTHILILGQGSTVFFGPRDEAIQYFESIGHPIPIRSNPSDIYLQLTNVDFASNATDGKQKVLDLVNSFAKSDINENMIKDIDTLIANPLPYSKKDVGYTNGFFYQTSVLMSRAFLNAAKNPLSYWVRVAMYVGLAILMGTTWLQMGLDQKTIADRFAGLFFSVAFLSFMAVAGIPAFLEERHVFIRETANGLYGIESYVISNFLISLPFIGIITLSFSSIAYFLIGFQSSIDHFFVFVGYLFLSLIIAEAQTVFISVAIPIFVAALAITAFTNGLWMVVQGFFVQKSNLPKFWYYTFHQVDFQKYAFELLLKNEFMGLILTCDSVDDMCGCMFPRNDTSKCELTGEDVLKHFDYDSINIGNWILIMTAILVFFKLSTYLILKLQNRQ